MKLDLLDFRRLNYSFVELQRRRRGGRTRRGKIIPRRHRHTGPEEKPWEDEQEPKWSLRLRMVGRMEMLLWDEEADSTESPTIPFVLPIELS